MDPSAIIAAVIAGATLAASETAGQAVKDTYGALKSLLINRFSIGSITTLEKAPNDEAFKRTLEKEIQLESKLLSDPEIKQLILDLYDQIENDPKKDTFRSIGVDISSVISQRDTIIRGVSGFQKGVRADTVESGQDTIIEDISGKSEA